MPWKVTGILRDRLHQVLRLDEEPRRIAAGLAVGVFISFTPYYGLHTLLVLALATLFRLNLAATLTGSLVVLPWFIPLVMGFSLELGRFLLGDEGPILWRHLGWHTLRANIVPLVLGTTVLGGVAAVTVYVGALYAIRRVREARIREAEPSRTGPAFP